MATLGQDLRAERERRSVSVKDVSDRTKIAARIISALEDDRWDEMPQNFFLKGMIKSYAQVIGADPAPFLAKLEEQMRIRSESPDQEHGFHGRKNREPADDAGAERSRPAARRKFVRAALVLLFLLLAATGGYWLFLRPEKSASSAIPSETAPIPLSRPAAVVPEEPKPAPVESGLRLEFRFNADSWMHIAADDVVVLEGIKPAGSTASLRAEREFIIQTGNAGGFDFTLNGRPGRPLGGSGVVLTDIRINSGNAGSFLRDDGGTGR